MQTQLPQTQVSSKVGQTVIHRFDYDHLKNTQNTHRRRRLKDDDLDHQLQGHTPLSAQNSKLIFISCLLQRPDPLSARKQLSQRQICLYRPKTYLGV